MILQSRPPQVRSELLVCLTKTGLLQEQLMRLADCALGHPDRRAFGSYKTVALSAGVPTSAVSRLAVGLGLSSFHELRDNFRNELRGIPQSRHVGASVRDWPRTIAGL
ncbi:hypothetical protein EQW76_19410 [Rhizobium sp. rho-13.1]|nr:hypothetical protein EQW76_19410 [Rhizobium sp. rho-13.1]TQY10932.1 hypothetical protein EQW74_18570 [Rhizobium sp. rho-1.1]